MEVVALDWSHGKKIKSKIAGGSVDEIASNWRMSYLDGHQRVAFMDECWRVLKPGGKLAIRVAHWSCMRAISDPYVKWPPICETSFLVFNKEWREKNGCGHYLIKSDFDFAYGFSLDQQVSQRAEDYKQYAVKHLNNAILDLMVTLTKRG